jgi:hypothetical protein
VKPIIYEPTTFITDLILAGMGVYFANRLADVYWQTFHPFHYNLTIGLYMFALGAFLGGISHGFGPHFSLTIKDIVWKGALVMVGLTTCYMLLSAFSAAFPYERYKLLRWIAFLATGVYIFIIIRDSNFANVIRFYAPAMIIVFLLMLYLYMDGNSPGSGYFLLGLIITLAGAAVQQSGFTVHKHFNHNDLFHVIQMIGLWYLYKGGMILRFLQPLQN